MSFIQSREYMNRGDVVRLDCDTQCNFMITTDSDFSSYQRGGRFQYYGGHYSRFPARIGVPHSDNWNLRRELLNLREHQRLQIAYFSNSFHSSRLLPRRFGENKPKTWLREKYFDSQPVVLCLVKTRTVQTCPPVWSDSLGRLGLQSQNPAQ